MTPKPSLSEVVNTGSKTEALEAIRDNLAQRLERSSDNEAAAIARQLVAAIEAVDRVPTGKASPVDEISDRRESRRAEAARARRSTV